MQNLYGRPPVPLPGWVSLRSDINYRSPKDILDTLNRLLPLQHPVEAGSPLTGSEVDIVSYTDTSDLIAKTVSAVTQCIGLGFKRPHIALITYRGRENSKLTPYDKLGPYSLRAPTGQYDLLGNADLHRGRRAHRLGASLQGPGLALRGVHRDRLRDARRRGRAPDLRRRDAGDDEAHAGGVGEVGAGVDAANLERAVAANIVYCHRPAAECTDPNHRDVILERRLHGTLARLNPDLPPEMLDVRTKKAEKATDTVLEHAESGFQSADPEFGV